jgi:hypothetical protein
VIDSLIELAPEHTIPRDNLHRTQEWQKMTETHPIRAELAEPVLSEIAVGGDFSVKLKVTCAEGCDLRGTPVEIACPNGGPVTSALATFADGVNETADVVLLAPPESGEYVWTVTMPAHETKTGRHEGCSCTIAARAKPHETSLAVWDIPSPVVTGHPFRIKAGAKCAAGCNLGGTTIEVVDESGTVVASGTFGDAPFPHTSALYWTELKLSAAPEEGLASLVARFAPVKKGLPHDGSASRFSTVVVRPPEHRLIVNVIEKETAVPVEAVHVHLGAYRAQTDPSGRAEVMLPKGTHELGIWKVGYEAPAQTLVVEADLAVTIEATVIPPEDPDTHWKM